MSNSSYRRRQLTEEDVRLRDLARQQEVFERAERQGQIAMTGFEDVVTKNLIQIRRHYQDTQMPTLRHLLPGVLALKGKPYTLDDYFPFEPVFRTRMPRRLLLKTGRQVAKSTSIAARGILTSISIPYFSILYVTPLFEMIRRFSHQYVRQFIEESPVKKLFTGSKVVNSVLQRTFHNGSSMYFSFAFLDAERTRGIPAHMNAIDEVQDIAFDLLEIIHQTLGASTWNLISYSGTPKSLDNTIEVLWQDSSQAEFAIKCHQPACNYWNIPALSHDLLDMIGPWTREIGPDRAGVICANCAKPLEPALHGRWIHGVKERKHTFPGFHIPQIIMPMHYANHEKWDEMIGAMVGRGNKTRTAFLNENCGESCDVGSKMITVTDLKNAANLPWGNRWQEGIRHIKRYKHRLLAVDWGGGGGRIGNSKRDSDKRLRQSFTSLAVLGIKYDGKIDCLWAHRSLRTHDFEYEARLCIEAAVKFQCKHIAHDYNGSGNLREHIIVQAGFPLRNMLPVTYMPTAKHNFVVEHLPDEDHDRFYYSVDRTRSLGLTCESMKYGYLNFFRYDFRGADEPGMLHDFLALQEEKVDSRIGTDVYVIVRNPNMPDDFAHAVNIGCAMLWNMTRQWPDLASAARFKLSKTMLRYLRPPKLDWDDIN